VYVSAVSLAGQWRGLDPKLPDGWAQAGLRLELADRATAERAAALLGPAQPYRAEPTVLRFSVARDGSAPSPEQVYSLLRRLDENRLGGLLTLVGTQNAAARPVREATSLVEAWDAALAGLPADWSDMYAEVQLTSTDYIERGAVLMVQMNPRRDGNRAALRFRCARTSGYGVSPEMARRCLERCDAEGIRGSVSILRVLSGSRHVGTQGPVWLAGGKTI
jgi:hypothetical protein